MLMIISIYVLLSEFVIVAVYVGNMKLIGTPEELLKLLNIERENLKCKLFLKIN